MADLPQNKLGGVTKYVKILDPTYYGTITITSDLTFERTIFKNSVIRYRIKSPKKRILGSTMNKVIRLMSKTIRTSDEIILNIGKTYVDTIKPDDLKKNQNMNEIPEVKMTLVSTPVVAKTQSLTCKWTIKECPAITGHSENVYYYETVYKGNNIHRFYARKPIARRLPKKQQLVVMNWLRKELETKDSGYVILREGSNFFDVISANELSSLI